MRFFFVCQGAVLRIYHRTAEQLAGLTQLEAASYAVADRVFYNRYVRREGPVEMKGEVLRQWEIAERGIRRRPTGDEMSRWEARLGVPSLWPAIVCDRRTYMGRLCKVRQDYKPYLSLQQLQGIAVETVETFWNAFERLAPDVVVGFTPATFEAILIYWIARAQGIPYLHLKSTKIANLVTFSSDIQEGHPHIKARYDEYLAGSDEFEDSFLKEAHEYVAGAIGKRVTYEGVIVKPTGDRPLSSFLRFMLMAPYAFFGDVRASLADEGLDTQRQPALSRLWEKEIGRIFRARAARRMMQPAMLNTDALSTTSYVFYPLNTEPEVALSVYGRYFLNQIEVARNIAQSLPLRSYLVIKEHPRSLGMRTAGYYRKLCEIPNVRFVPVEVSTAEVVRHAQAVTVISGFVGFEAALQGKPAIVLGHCPYIMLPDTMVRRVQSMEELPIVLAKLTKQYKWNQHALVSYVAAVMRESVPVDLWSTLLGKKGRLRGTGSSTSQRSQAEQYNALAVHLLRRLEEEQKHMH